jgi:hypothetical protein
MKKILLIGLLALPLAACGNDADPGTRDTGAAKARINMPDNFPTVAHKCYGTNGVYVTNSAEASPGGLYVVQNDPECGGATQGVE